MSQRRSQLASEINAARGLVVKLRSRLPRQDDDVGIWPAPERVLDASAAWHLEQAARHLARAAATWDEPEGEKHG